MNRSRSGWSKTRLKYIADCNTSVLHEDTDSDFEFDYVDISSVTQGAVSPDLERLRFSDAPSRARRLATAGDTVISTVRTYLKAAAVVPSFGEPTVFSTGFAVLHPRPSRVDSRFLGYLIQSDDFIHRMVANSTGVSYPAITAKTLMDLPVDVPPIGEQGTIANFLDREMTKIDTLVEKQNRFMDAARDRLVSFTFELATGKNLSASLLDSRVTWLGSCPSHWIVGNIRRFASMRTGHTPSRTRDEYWGNCYIPWFTLADVWQLRAGHMYLGETSGSISDLGLANSAAELLPTGTVVLSRTASVGFVGIMPRPMATSQDFWNWVCGPQLKPEYLYFVFTAMRAEFEALRMGSTHQTIYQGDAASFKIPVPSLSEQTEIASRLSAAKAQAEELIRTAQRMIELAQERRAALITAAVTGQLDLSTGKVG